jgi:hypothetical protein
VRECWSDDQLGFLSRHDILSYTIVNQRVSLNLCKMKSHPSVFFSPLTTRSDSYLTTYSTPSSPTYSKSIPVPDQACSKRTTTLYTVRPPPHLYEQIIDIEDLAQQWQNKLSTLTGVSAVLSKGRKKTR